MHFSIYCHDKPGALEVRLSNRDDHLAYIREPSLPILAAGPLLSDDGQDMIGSLIVIEAGDLAAAQAWAANDPYAKAGLFADVKIKPFRWVINPPA